MTNTEALARLNKLGKECDRKWLKSVTGYSINTLYNALRGAERPLNKWMSEKFERVFSEEERRKDVDPDKPDATVWDLVYFSGKELNTIDRAKKAGGYESLPDFYRDAVIAFADSIMAGEAMKEHETRQKQVVRGVLPVSDRSTLNEEPAAKTPRR